MIGDLFSRLFKRRGPAPEPAVELPELDLPSHLFDAAHGLPRIDWDAADAWAEAAATDAENADLLRRAAAAEWLDRLAEALSGEHARWRRARVEGVAPTAGGMHGRIARVTDRAATEIPRALGPLREGAPVPPVAVAATGSKADYVSLAAQFYEDEGEWATSGGIYVRLPFPLIALPTSAGWAVGATIAHELTHHYLADLGLPTWVEEGLTQMMEERVDGAATFRYDHEMARRHRDRWGEVGLDRFWRGEAFSSPEEDDQELAYNLAQAIVRPLLGDAPKAFFAFARACGSLGPAEAARLHLNATLGQVAARTLGPGDWEPAEFE